MDTVNAIAALYARQSQGNERSIEEQIQAGQKACEREGWRLLESYTDKVSASRFSRSKRPDWTRLITDLEAGRFGILVMWESSRGDRDLETWAGLLRRCREQGVLIHVVNHGHTYDVRRGRDWKTLAEDGVDAAAESDRTSERLQRAMQAAALDGRPHGAVNYGYRRVYDTVTRQLVRQEPDPEQAPVMRQIITRIAHGDPVKTITEDLNERGIPSPHGGRWARTVVRRLALNPVYIGKRKWQGELLNGDWPALVDEPAYWRAYRVLTDPARLTTRPGAQKHLLSYLAICGVCGSKLWMYRQGQRKPMYACSSGHGCVYADATLLDAYVSGRMVTLLKNPVMIKALFGRTDDAAIIAARAEADELRERLDGYASMAARKEITPLFAARVEKELAPQIAAAERRAVVVAVSPQIAELITSDDVERGWAELAVRHQRAFLRACWASIELLKPPRRTTKFDPARVRMTRLGPDDAAR